MSDETQIERTRAAMGLPDLPDGGRCILCTAPLDSAPVIGTRDRDGVEVRRVECPTCGLVQAHPRPTAEEIATHYAGDYWRDRKPAVLYLMSPNGDVDAVAPADAERYEAALDTMARGRIEALERDLQLPPGARVLEVGCGDGRTLAGMLGLGWDAEGIEPDAGKAAAARERVGRSDRVVCATLDRVCVAMDRGELAGSADAIVSFHVLEHVHDPLAALATMRRLLRPGGVLWLEVPDLGSARQPLDGSWWQWAHLVDFTAATLTAMLRCAGLVGVEVRQTLGGLQAMGQHDPAVAAQPYEAPKPERSVLARFMGGESLEEIHASAPLNTLAVVEHQMRLDFKRYVEGVHRLGATFSAAHRMIGEAGDAMGVDANGRLEAWHPDPYIHGFTMGEAYAMQRGSSLVSHLANVMRMAELTDGEREKR